jgi:hypothetical protein
MATASPEASPTSESTPSPTGPVLPSAEPTGASWTPRPAEALLGDSLVSVVVDRLNLREKPTVDSESLGVVEKGDFLWIDSSPFSHDGYSWYHAALVAPAGEPPGVGDKILGHDKNGWIAVAKADSRYVKAFPPRCPATIDVSSVQSMLGSEKLACFGSNTIELTGTFGCGGCGGTGPGSYDPAWLVGPFNPFLLGPNPINGGSGSFGLRFAPAGPGAPTSGSVIRVRGHFDDPASATCAISVVDPLHPNGQNLVAIPSEAAQLYCAQQFVGESVEVLGTDPTFLLG